MDLKTHVSQIPTAEEVVGIIKAYQDLFGLYLDYDAIMMHLTKSLSDRYKYSKLLLGTTDKRVPASTADLYVETTLTAMASSLTELKKTKTGRLSLNKDDLALLVQENPDNEDLAHIIQNYNAFNEADYNARLLLSYTQFPLDSKLSCNNHRMLRVRPEWSIQNTYRIAMSNPAIQGIPRNLQSIITVPQGYVFVDSDSSQIDPRWSALILNDDRLLKFINSYGDAYYGFGAFAALTDDQIAGVAPIDYTAKEITDEMKAHRQEVKAEVNGVMYGSTSNKNNSEVKANLIKRIGEHPARVAWLNKIDQEILHGDFFAYTDFGDKMDIRSSSKLDKNIPLEQQDYQIKKLKINYRIQGDSACCQRAAIKHAHLQIQTYSPTSAILMSVHDAIAFAIKEEDMNKPEIKQWIDHATEFNIDDKITIPCENIIGRSTDKDMW